MGRVHRYVLLALSVLALSGFASAKSQPTPCHPNKNRMGDGVTCTRLSIPKGLCAACPLKPALRNGNFADCAAIYDAAAPNCLEKVREYTAANPCDKQRVDAIAALEKNPKDAAATSVVDYFLYSACEQCCDCIPIGANARLFDAYAKTHTSKRPTLWTVFRGNCPAHAKYDICKIAPKVTHFAGVGDPPVKDADKLPAVCPLLDDWRNKPENKRWQQQAETKLVPEVATFLGGMLEHLGCDDKKIWEGCHMLESSQKHLGKPEARPKPVPKESEKPTEPVKETPKAEPDASPTDVPADGGVPNPGDVNDAVGAEPSTEATVPAPCFPAKATVQLRSGATVAMENLRIGDEVLAAPGKYSPVFLFSHRDASFRTTHLQISTSAGGSLTLTPGHHLPVNGAHAPASSIVAGDILDGVDGPLTVASVARVARTGLYNPHTIAGTVVVDGVVCSTYTEAVRPPAAQALLAPLRALFRVGGVSEETTGGFLRHGGGGVPAALCLA